MNVYIVYPPKPAPPTPPPPPSPPPDNNNNIILYYIRIRILMASLIFFLPHPPWYMCVGTDFKIIFVIPFNLLCQITLSIPPPLNNIAKYSLCRFTQYFRINKFASENRRYYTRHSAESSILKKAINFSRTCSC